MIIVSCKGIQLGLATFVGNFFHSHTLCLSPQVSIRRLSLVVREHNINMVPGRSLRSLSATYLRVHVVQSEPEEAL